MQAVKVVLKKSVRQTDRLYSYSVPAALSDAIKEGQCVEVFFGGAKTPKLAYVFEVYDETDPKMLKILKPITRIVDIIPVLTGEQIALCTPVSKRYSCSLGDAASLMIPASVGKRKATEAWFINVNPDLANEALEKNLLRSVAHISVLNYLLSNGETEKELLKRDTKVSDNQLQLLRRKEYIVFSRRPLLISETPENSSKASDVSVSEKFKEEHVLNDEQRRAYEEITADFSGTRVFLLHGVTGSGKTEVYLNCARKVLSDGHGVLYLVPEISLTPQTVNWIRGRLGNEVAVLHSGLSDKERYEAWDRLRRGEVRIAVAARSGIFAPVKDLKLIIIDEEHDSSYKSDTHPRYSAKDVALLRARYLKATVVLGSATPAVESYYAASLGVYKLLQLKKRAKGSGNLPEVIPVDMKEQMKLGMGEILSLPLRSAMASAFSQNHQVMLFLNRRGYSRTLTCMDCGEMVNCPNCSIGMTVHNNSRSEDRLLICHYCGYTIPVSEAKCPKCSGKNLKRIGFGTQQLQEMITKLFPEQKVLRMDQDTTAVTGSHARILAEFASGNASVLVGTQMIAKGHDFPNVTVVGILGADMMMNSSDYRSSERAFELMTQASGRAGRGDLKGEVYIQTYRPDLPLFKYAASQDYESFYQEEIRYREAMNLPPFKALGEIIISLEDEELLRQRACELGKYLNDYLSIQDKKYAFELFGPMEAPIYELRGKFRMNFVIKATNKSCLTAVYKQIFKDFDSDKYPISVDSDSIR